MGPAMISYQIPVLWHGNQNPVSGVVWTLSAGLKKVGCSATRDSVHVITEMGDRRELKMRFHVSGARTQAIFDDAFTELVDAAQPIPGFRRTKGEDDIGSTIGCKSPKSVVEARELWRWQDGASRGGGCVASKLSMEAPILLCFHLGFEERKVLFEEKRLIFRRRYCCISLDHQK